MDIFAKPPSVLCALAGDPFGLRAVEAAAKTLRVVEPMFPAGAALPRFRMPRLLDVGVMAEIERTMAPLRNAMLAIRFPALAEKALACVPTIPTFSTME